jgi:hypothetical protein
MLQILPGHMIGIVVHIRVEVISLDLEQPRASA